MAARRTGGTVIGRMYGLDGESSPPANSKIGCSKFQHNGRCEHTQHFKANKNLPTKRHCDLLSLLSIVWNFLGYCKRQPLRTEARTPD